MCRNMRSVSKKEIVPKIIGFFRKRARYIVYPILQFTKNIQVNTRVILKTIDDTTAATLSLFLSLPHRKCAKFVNRTDHESDSETRRLRALDLLIVNRLGRACTSRVRYKRHFIRGRRVWARATYGRITVIATAGNANSLMHRFHTRIPHR